MSIGGQENVKDRLILYVIIGRAEADRVEQNHPLHAHQFAESRENNAEDLACCTEISHSVF